MYVVFWGTQWGTRSTDSNGNLKFSNDTAGAAGRVQQLIKGGFCAWHDSNSDLGASSPYGEILLTNLPYVLDVGTKCGQNFVNAAGSAGTLDGFTIVEGAQYADTLTDLSRRAAGRPALPTAPGR